MLLLVGLGPFTDRGDRFPFPEILAQTIIESSPPFPLPGEVKLESVCVEGKERITS